MIAPMKKVHLVVLDGERREALKLLRSLGVLHLETPGTSGPALDAAAERRSKAEAALGVIRDLKVPKGAAVPAEDAPAIVRRALALDEERKSCHESRSRDARELERLEPWGDFDPEALKALSVAGYSILPCETDSKSFAAWKDAPRLVVLSRTGKTVRFALVREAGEAEAELPRAALPLALPELGRAALKAKRDAAGARLTEIGRELTALAAAKGRLEAYKAQLEAEIEFEAAGAGMVSVAGEAGEAALARLAGYVPAERLADLVAAAKKHGWALLADDPAADDAVPTLVKNSPVVAIVQPIFDFLGTVPNYREYDISALFLLFFCFFFGMIFGDAVYGAVLFSAGLAAAFAAKRKGRGIPTAVRLLLTLSAFTMAWGVLTLTYLGLPPEKLPAILKTFSLYWLSNENPASGDNVKIFCFVMGTVQLSLAHLKNVRRDIATLKWLGQAGQLLMMVGMVFVVFNLVISPAKFPIPDFSLVLLAVGFFLSFVFSNYDAGSSPNFFMRVLLSILGSLANFVSVFLGVVNVFADIVSYIRLWAVGLAGLAISNTLNTLIGPMLGKFSLFIFAFLFLCLGHGFNILLSFLSVVVHGVRLNMLEFSGHLGMEWSGFSYRPFAERISDDEKTSKEQA